MPHPKTTSFSYENNYVCLSPYGHPIVGLWLCSLKKIWGSLCYWGYVCYDYWYLPGRNLYRTCVFIGFRTLPKPLYNSCLVHVPGNNAGLCPQDNAALLISEGRVLTGNCKNLWGALEKVLLICGCIFMVSVFVFLFLLGWKTIVGTRIV